MFSRVVSKLRRGAFSSIRSAHPILNTVTINLGDTTASSYSSMRRRFSTRQDIPNIAQGISGPCQLITGDFEFFTQIEARNIQRCLKLASVLVMVFDRDAIPVPANERAMWIREYFNHDPRLEVRICYGAPNHDETSKMVSFLRKQIPQHITVASVNCHNTFSDKLASMLGAEFHGFEQSAALDSALAQLKSSPEKHQHLLIPSLVERVINRFSHPIPQPDIIAASQREIREVSADLEKLNPNHPNKETFTSRVPWDLSALNKINLPVIIGSLNGSKNREAFSDITTIQVFDMPIYMPKQGWKIPKELTHYLPVIAKVIAAETLSNPDIDSYNAYLTIDCGVVAPRTFARREGLHVDGFLTSANTNGATTWGDNTYVVSNQQALQTEFYPGPFDLSNVDKDDPTAVLEALAKQGENMTFWQAKPYDIVKMSVNNVHAVHPNLTDRHLARTFLKMTFSERLFNRSGNTANPFLDYRFTYVPRANGRNTQNYAGTVPSGYLDVRLDELSKNDKLPEWIIGTKFKITKKEDVIVTATPAKEGEILETRVGQDLITRNIARKGDMKVSRTPVDSYFLGKQFEHLYERIEGRFFKPKARTLHAYQVARPISFIASWGTRQNIPAGGVVVEDNCERWGVHPESFHATYSTIL